MSEIDMLQQKTRGLPNFKSIYLYIILYIYLSMPLPTTFFLAISLEACSGIIILEFPSLCWDFFTWQRFLECQVTKSPHFSGSIEIIIPIYPNFIWLVVEPSPLKNMSSSVGVTIPNVWKVIKFHGSSHHQPVVVSQPSTSGQYFFTHSTP